MNALLEQSEIPVTVSDRSSWRSAAVPVVVGPTCVGKTELTQQLADEFPLEVINVDSFQIYSHFSVGTGRSDMALKRRHLYGFLDPMLRLSGEEYVHRAGEAIQRIQDNGNWPICEGGSLTFLRALSRSYQLRLVGIRPFSREWIETRIARRMDRRFEATLLEEIREGLRMGYRDSRVLTDDVVYLPLVRFLDGEITLGQARDRIRDNLLRMNCRQMSDYDEFEIEWLLPTTALGRLRQIVSEYVVVSGSSHNSHV